MFTARKKNFVVLSVLMFVANVLAPNVAFGITHSTTFNLNVLQSTLNYTLSATNIASLPQGSTGASTVTATLTSGAQPVNLTLSRILDASGNNVLGKMDGTGIQLVNFSPSTVTPTASSVLTIRADNNVPAGAYTSYVESNTTDNAAINTRSANFNIVVTAMSCPATRVVTGTTSVTRGIWGSGHWQKLMNPPQPEQYTDDSDVPRAIVHDGKLLAGETATIGLISTGSSANYLGSFHNNIWTAPWNSSWPGMRFCVATPVPKNIVVTPSCSAGPPSVPTMTIGWTKPKDDSGTPVTPDSYNIYRNGILINTFPVSNSATTYTDSAGLSLGGLYGYQVEAVYGAGKGKSVLSNSTQAPSSCTPTLSASLTANPASGFAPLNGVLLTVPPVSGSATDLVTYAFKCKNTDPSWSTNQTSDGNSAVTYTNTCSYPTAGTYTASARVTRQGITVTPDLTATVTTNSYTCSIGTITASGNDLLIPVTVSPFSSIWFYLTSNMGFSAEDRRTTSETFTDYGAALQVGNHIYTLTYNSCNATGNYVVNSNASFNLAATGPMEIITTGTQNRDLASTPSTITIQPTGGFTGNVILSLISIKNTADGTEVSNLPQFKNYAFSALTIPYNGNSQLIITSKNGSQHIPAGNYLLTIQGVSGSVTKTTTVQLRVGAASFKYIEI